MATTIMAITSKNTFDILTTRLAMSNVVLAIPTTTTIRIKLQELPELRASELRWPVVVLSLLVQVTSIQGIPRLRDRTTTTMLITYRHLSSSKWHVILPRIEDSLSHPCSPNHAIATWIKILMEA
jgi:hypothetical protein